MLGFPRWNCAVQGQTPLSRRHRVRFGLCKRAWSLSAELPREAFQQRLLVCRKKTPHKPTKQNPHFPASQTPSGHRGVPHLRLLLLQVCTKHHPRDGELLAERSRDVSHASSGSRAVSHASFGSRAVSHASSGSPDMSHAMLRVPPPGSQRRHLRQSRHIPARGAPRVPLCCAGLTLPAPRHP